MLRCKNLIGFYDRFSIRQDEYFCVFKQGRRRFASYAIVNAAMRVKLKATLSDKDANFNKVEESERKSTWIVEELGVVYGGLRSTPLVATRTIDALVGRYVSYSLATKLQNVLREILCNANYRGSLPKLLKRRNKQLLHAAIS